MGSLIKSINAGDVARIMQAVQLNERGGQYTRRWEHIDALLQTCAPYVWLIRDAALGRLSESTRSNVAPIIRFYNDTVHYILGGHRVVSVQTWDDVVRTALDQGSIEPTRQRAGNIGTQILANYTTDVDCQNAITSQVKPKLRREILNLSDADIITMWITRQNGIDDMAHSLALFAQVYTMYGPRE